MLEIFAQLQGADVTAIAIQTTVGGLAIFMLRWFMTKNDANMSAMAVSHDRLRVENAASNERLSRELIASNERLWREISASNERMARSHLMLVIALDGVNEAAKARARDLVADIDKAMQAKQKNEGQ